MSGHSAFNASSETLSSKHVGKWETNVRVFFNDEWSRLRTLIMSMEEESWNDAVPASGTRACVLSIGANSDSVSTGNGTMDQNGEQTPDKQPAYPADRLSVLERRIEQRLRIASTGRR